MKRPACDCHDECYVGPGDLMEVDEQGLAQWCQPHPCTALCTWPSCLSADEADELARQVLHDAELRGDA